MQALSMKKAAFSSAHFSGASQSLYRANGGDAGDSFHSTAAPHFGKFNNLLSLTLGSLLLLTTSCFNLSKPKETKSIGETLVTLPHDTNQNSILGKPGRYLIKFIKTPAGPIVAQANNIIGQEVGSYTLKLSANDTTDYDSLTKALKIKLMNAFTIKLAEEAGSFATGNP